LRGILIPHSKKSPREALASLLKLIPLSFEGEGDTGGEVANYPIPLLFSSFCHKKPQPSSGSWWIGRIKNQVKRR